MTVDEDGRDALVGALTGLRSRLVELRLALAVPSAPPAAAERTRVVAQLDDYLLPRLRQPGAPLLVVVGGSTGAGKSTLVNSLLGRQVSATGVLRPTTRHPVLVHNPLDARWFTTDRVLPRLARVTEAAGQGGGDGSPAQAGQRLLRLVAAEALPRGLALLDAPDIDSVEAGNRDLAAELLGAADVWLFVTTAARYADAVPWELLGQAARRRTHLVIVLDRVDPAAVDVLREDLEAMLTARGLAGTAVLTVPETGGDGLLPEPAIAPVADWLTALAGDPAAGAAAVARTRDGAVDDVVASALDIAVAADDQRDADARLRAAVVAAYDAAAEQVARVTSDGSLLRGEVLARWQDVVGTGEVFRAMEQGVSRLRDRLGAALRGRRPPEPALAAAVGHQLHAVVLDAAEQAAERADAHWRHDPAGAALLGGLGLSRASADLPEAVAAQVRAWQGDVLALVSAEGAGRRGTARALSLGVNGAGAALMIAVFASTGGLTGAEVGIVGGSALLAQRVLEAVFGDEAVRRLAREAHQGLDRRVRELLAGESARFTAQLDALGGAEQDGEAVRAAAGLVQATVAGLRAATDRPPGDDVAVSGEAGHDGTRRGPGALRGAGMGAAAVAAEVAPPQPRRRWWQRLGGSGRGR